ncbi:MAG: hypothetical protein M0R73_13420 [Dehalococcoidia bacterium]|nr:hypothetical protein [Dehalococcoidia bacterium]
MRLTDDEKVVQAHALLTSITSLDVRQAVEVLEPLVAHAITAQPAMDADSMRDRREAAQRKASAGRKAELIAKLDGLSPRASTDSVESLRAKLWVLLTPEERVEWRDRWTAQRDARRTVADVSRTGP